MCNLALKVVLTALLCGPAVADMRPAEESELRRLEFFIGDWSATGQIFAEKYGDRAGPATGRAHYRWVNRRTWLLSEVSLESSFSYGVTIMIAIDPKTMAYRAFAMTNFSPHAVAYQGYWRDDSTLVFEGALDPGGLRRQRVIYEKRADGKLQFRAEESHDGGASYVPDSELLLERQCANNSMP